MDRTLHELCERLTDEIKDIIKEVEKKDKMSAGELETIDKLSHALKSIKTIIAMDEAYSGDEHPYHYDGGMSGAGRGVKRDSMGRYADMSRRYYRDGERENVANELRQMMNDTSDSHIKDMLHRFVSEIEKG